MQVKKMRGYQDNFTRELIVDFFAGGGGASIGIELAAGRPVDIAVNHDPDAIAMHKVNHPYTRHFQEDVFAINPEETTGGRPVVIMWASPDCKHFSKAKGGAPVEKKIRGLALGYVKRFSPMHLYGKRRRNSDVGTARRSGRQDAPRPEKSG